MADASHELRTPVSVVRTTAQVTLARDGRPEHDYRESLTIVEEQSARLARLVDAMFLLSRAEAQGIPLMREPLYLDDLVAECARALRVLADERHVTIRTGGDAEVMFSGGQHAAESDGRQPARQRHPARQDRWNRHRDSRSRSHRLTIRIADDGEGIPPEHRSGSSSGSSGLTPVARRGVSGCPSPAGLRRRTEDADARMTQRQPGAVSPSLVRLVALSSSVHLDVEIIRS